MYEAGTVSFKLPVVPLNLSIITADGKIGSISAGMIALGLVTNLQVPLRRKYLIKVPSVCGIDKLSAVSGDIA